jgi:hypothetical protein
MDQGPLVKEQIEAGAWLAQEFSAQYRPLRAAFWLKESEGRWYLYLVPDQIDDSGVSPAYAEITRLVGPDRQDWLGPFQVKVATPNDPVARSVIEKQEKYGRFATRLHGMVGGRYVDEVFVYPLPIAARSEAVATT